MSTIARLRADAKGEMSGAAAKTKKHLSRGAKPAVESLETRVLLTTTYGPVAYDSADGNWYQAVHVSQGITWTDAKVGAVAKGGFLACPTTAAQNKFVFSLVNSSSYLTPISINGDRLGPWIGAYSSNDYNGHSATWRWVNGAAFSYHNWYPHQPDGYPGTKPNQAIDYYDFKAIGSTWGDAPQGSIAGFALPRGYIIQYKKNPIVDVPPKITTQPADQTVYAGNTVTFTVAGTGYPTPLVQWQVSKNSGKTWGNISGATSHTLKFATTPTENHYEYRAILTNIKGAAVSRAASLDVIIIT